MLDNLIGLITVLLYILFFIIIYWTSRHKLSLNITKTRGFTISEALQHCNKYIAIVIFVLFFGFVQMLYISKNLSYMILVINLLIMLGSFLLFIIHSHNNRLFHTIIAILVSLFMVINIILVLNLEMSANKNLYYFKEISILNIVCCSILILIFLFSLISPNYYLTLLINILEMACVILFGLLLLILTQLEPIKT